MLGLGETFGHKTKFSNLVILRRCRRISNSEEITREQPAIIFVQQCFLGTKKINSGFVQPPLLLVWDSSATPQNDGLVERWSYSGTYICNPTINWNLKWFDEIDCWNLDKLPSVEPISSPLSSWGVAEGSQIAKRFDSSNPLLSLLDNDFWGQMETIVALFNRPVYWCEILRQRLRMTV